MTPKVTAQTSLIPVEPPIRTLEEIPAETRVFLDSIAPQADCFYEESHTLYANEQMTTEALHPKTECASQDFIVDPLKSLKDLQSVDSEILEGFDHFCSGYLPSLYQEVSRRLLSDGKLHLVGAGSSGRVAIDLGARFPSQISGIIAGGDRAFVRPREGFEDSEEEGRKAIEAARISQKDYVILISASGSARYNLGAGREALRRGAGVGYFFNNTRPPESLSRFLDQPNVMKLLVETGPQAIAGSTRLQAASLALLCLGTLLRALSSDKPLETITYDQRTLTDWALGAVRKKLPDIAKLTKKQIEILNSEDANFRRLVDETECGYITFIARKALREAMIDTSEMHPTFSTNGAKQTGEPGKRAEFQAFSSDSGDNIGVWRQMLENYNPQGCKDLLINWSGVEERPKGQGNLVVNVLKQQERPFFTETASAVIAVSNNRPHFSEERHPLQVLITNLPNDRVGITHSLALKWVLNLVSNATMLGLGKVFGNRMIDVNPSNDKLIRRTCRLVASLFPHDIPYRTLLHYVFGAKSYRDGLNHYAPSVVKLAALALKFGIGFDKAADLLLEENEQLDKFFA